MSEEPFVSGYKNNVFLSYRWLDNKADWVTALHDHVQVRLGELLGRDNACVWRDGAQTQAGDALDATIAREIDASAVFVSVMTPGFKRHSYVHKEVERFRGPHRRGEMVVDGSSRWIRIIKTPYDRSDEPTVLVPDEETIELRFYEPNPQNPEQWTEFEPGTPEFRGAANRLSESIWRLLQKMQRRAATPSLPDAVRVFIAETTSDRKTDRAFIRSDLGGDIVAPSFTTMEINELEAEIDRSLAGCALSIHVLGARYGVRPEGEAARSLPRVQFEQAANTYRLVWIPKELPEVEAEQQAFLDEIAGYTGERLDVVRSGRQEFLEHARDVLAKLAAPELPPVEGKAIYLVSDFADLARREVRELANVLRTEGYFVEQPVFEGERAEIQAAEKLTLQETNATVLFFGDAPDAWIQSRRKEILRELGELNVAPGHHRAVYLCGPETSVKRNVYMDLPGGVLPERGGPPLLVLGDCGDVATQKLDPLLHRLKRASE